MNKIRNGLGIVVRVLALFCLCCPASSGGVHVVADGLQLAERFGADMFSDNGQLNDAADFLRFGRVLPQAAVVRLQNLAEAVARYFENRVALHEENHERLCSESSSDEHAAADLLGQTSRTEVQRVLVAGDLTIAYECCFLRNNLLFYYYSCWIYLY